jgi:hypothetical protein
MGKSNKKSTAASEAASENKKSGKPTIPAETFKADDVEYKFTRAIFNLDGVVMTAAAALKDEKVLAKLVDVKAGVIAPVEQED